MKLVKNIYPLAIILFLLLLANACKKDIPPQVPVTWYLNHDDSIKCKTIDKKDTLIFLFNDTTQGIFKLITAIKTKTEDPYSVSKAQDPDPSRDMGALITVYYKEYTYWDSVNNFPLVITIAPTFDQTGTIRLNSKFQMYFNNRIWYTSYIHENGLPLNYMTHDSFVYNNRVYRNCYYNQFAYDMNLGLQILDATAFPLWLENKEQKFNIDFLPK